MKDWLKYSLANVGFFLLGFVCLHYCQPQPQAGSHTIEKHVEHIYDSTPKVIVPNVAPSITTHCFYPVPTDVDTALVLKLFFAKATYTQTIEDTLLRAKLSDTVSENKIIGRSFSYQLLKPIRTIESSTVTIRESANGVYLGAFVNGGKDRLGFGPQLGLGRERMHFNAGWDLLNKEARIAASYRLNARGKRNIKP
jgi:hypothetical protein